MPRRKSPAPSVAESQSSDLPATAGSEWNAEMLSNYKKAIDGLQQLWPEVVTEDPLLVKDGGREAPFHSSNFTAVLLSEDIKKKSYRCGQNWFRHNLFWNPTSGTPIRSSVVDMIIKHHFEEPAHYPTVLQVHVAKEVGYQGAVQPVPGEEPVFARVRMISPVEMDYAFVFAAWRDKDDHIKMDQWKRFFLSTSFEYRMDDVPLDELHMFAVQERQNFELQGVALKHSPLQLMFSVLGFKTEYEQRHGPIKSEVLAKRYEDSITWANPEEAVSPSFVDTACTMGNRVLKDQDLANLLLSADEDKKNPFNSWSKYQILIQQGKNPDGIKWVFFAVYDGVKHGYLGKDATSNRNLQSLTCKILLAQQTCLNLLMSYMETECADWPPHVRQAIKGASANHKALREKELSADETWRAGWPDSAERFWQLVRGSIYDLEYWSCLTCLVKNRRSTTEFLEAPQFADELQQIQDAMRQENKDKRKAENKGKLDEEPMPASDEEDDQPTDPIKTTCTHMVIGETDKPELPFKKDANADEVTKLHDRLMAFKKLAQRKVATNIKLIVEPNSESELVDLYMDTFLKDYTSEWRTLHPGEDPHCVSTLMHVFDSKKASEAGSQPKVRPPPLKDGRLMKLLSAVSRVRFKDNCDGAPTFAPGDFIMLADGGRPGNKSVLTTLKKGDAPVQRCERTMMVIYDEDSIMERRERRNTHAIKQSENIHLLMPPSSLKVLKKARINYTGTNRGDVIYGVKMPSFDSIWRMTVGEKKLLFGKHRVPVGGQAPEGTEPEGRRPDASEEPAFYHAGPWSLDEELVHDFSVGGINDLTAGDGSLAMISIRKNLPYVGLTFSEYHSKKLIERLEALTFESMQNPKDPLYSNELVKLIKESKKVGSKSDDPKKRETGKGKDDKPKKTGKKTEPVHEESDAEEEEGSDEGETGVGRKDDDEVSVEKDGVKTPEWLNSDGEVTSEPSDLDNHEVGKLMKDAEAAAAAPKAKAKAKAKGKAKAKSAPKKQKEPKEKAKAKAKGKKVVAVEPEEDDEDEDQDDEMDESCAPIQDQEESEEEEEPEPVMKKPSAKTTNKKRKDTSKDKDAGAVAAKSRKMAKGHRRAGTSA